MKIQTRFTVPRAPDTKCIHFRRRAGDVAADVFVALCVGCVLILGYLGP